jgi:hypothetical protein
VEVAAEDPVVVSEERAVVPVAIEPQLDFQYHPVQLLQ